MTTQQQTKPAPPKKTDWRTIHRRLNPDMLYAEDLGGRKSIDVEIIDSGVAMLKQRDGKRKEMPWLAFKGARKKLGLGATMCKTMRTMTGSRYIEDWRGWITLVVITTTYRDSDTGQQETTDAIRISPRRPRPHAGDVPVIPEVPEPPPDNEPPALDPAFVASSDLSDEDKRAIEMAEREEAKNQ